MSHPYYEEEQRFSNKRWIWFALVTLFLLSIIMVVYENRSLDQKNISMMLLGVTFAFLPIVAILFYSKFQFRIDREGIHYKFFPAVLRWRVIAKEMIESFEVTAKRSLFEKIECGYSRNRLNRTIMMNISGIKFARIKLKDGRRFKIGSENPESLERALRKLVSIDNQ